MIRRLRWFRDARRCRHIVVAAALVLALQLVLPAYVVAAAAGVPGARVPVCTGTGIVWLDPTKGPDAPQTAPGSAPAKAGIYCPLCVGHGAPATLSVVAPVPVPAAVVLPSILPLPVAAVLPRPAPSPHRSRAPPVSA